jgi:hypothetical protein
MDPVRVLAAAATQFQCICVQNLQLRDPQARRMPFRFRKDPLAYLAALEEKLLKQCLPT